MRPAQLAVFERDSFGALVGVANGTTIDMETVIGFDDKQHAADAAVARLREMVSTPDDRLVLYDPNPYATTNTLGDIERQTGWSGASFSSILDHFASFHANEWDPPFHLAHGATPPEPPYDIYTDGTYTPVDAQDEGRTTGGVGFVISGTNERMYACGAPAPHLTDSLNSEYYAILSALSAVPQHEEATVHTDHRNVPTVAHGDAPDRCSHITDPLVRLFETTPSLSIEHVHRSATRLADGLATAGTRQAIELGTPPR